MYCEENMYDIEDIIIPIKTKNGDRAHTNCYKLKQEYTAYESIYE